MLITIEVQRSKGFHTAVAQCSEISILSLKVSLFYGIPYMMAISIADIDEKI